MYRYIKSSYLYTYRGIPVNIENNGDQRYYFQDPNTREFKYAELEDEILSKIDELKDVKGSANVCSSTYYIDDLYDAMRHDETCMKSYSDDPEWLLTKLQLASDKELVKLAKKYLHEDWR